jgi:hypothetical protein
LAFFTASSTLRAQTPNPVLDLKFDEGTGRTAADSSDNNNNATLLGSAGWTARIVGPFALSEPGIPGSYADIPTDVVDTTKSFTVAAWVKLTTLPGYQTFVSEDGVNVGGNAQSAFFLQKRDDTQQFSFTVPYDFFTLPQSGFTPVVGTWYHLAGVYDANAQSASLYVNGVLADMIFNVVPHQATGHTGIGHGEFLGN